MRKQHQNKSWDPFCLACSWGSCSIAYTWDSEPWQSTVVLLFPSWENRPVRKITWQEALQVFDLCSKLSLSSKCPVGKVFTGFQGAICSTNSSSFITGSHDAPSIHFLPPIYSKTSSISTNLLNFNSGKLEISRCYLFKCSFTKPCVRSRKIQFPSRLWNEEKQAGKKTVMRENGK